MKVIIQGFKTEEQAREFCYWYSGGGEQDFANYLDCQDDLDFSSADCVSIITKNDETFLTVEPR